VLEIAGLAHPPIKGGHPGGHALHRESVQPGSRAKEAWASGGTAARGSPTPAGNSGGSHNNTVGSETIGGSSGASALAHSSPSATQPARPKMARDPSERCSRCTMEAVWAACDVFWEFDVSHTGRITRPAYIQQLGQTPTVMRLRMLRRARLEARFRDSAQPVTLDEFLRLLWPAAQEKDFKLMRRWAQLREALSVMQSENFRGQDHELNTVFAHLDARAEGRIPAQELVRAQILPREQLQRLTKTMDLKHFLIDKETFRSLIWPDLRVRYIRSDTLARMKREEESMMNNTFAGAFNMGVGDKAGSK